MHILALIAIVATVSYIAFGTYILILDYRSRLHRLFFYMALTLSVWAFCAFWVYEAKSVETVRWWVKISFPAPVLFYAFALHFALELFRAGRPSPRFLSLLYVPAAYFIFLNFTSYTMYSGFVQHGKTWVFETATDFARGRSFIMYYGAYLSACLVLFFIRSRKVQSFREKMQSMVLFSSLLITLVVASFEGVILPEITGYRSPQPAPIMLMIWIGGILFAMVRYRFLNISHTMVSEDLADNISDAIILLDRESGIITLNTKAEDITGFSKESLLHKEISVLIDEYRTVMKEIDRMIGGAFSSFAGRVHLVNRDDGHIFMDARFSVVRDRFGDPIGTMVICREVKEARQFREHYSITGREVEIIQHIISGQSNKEISSALNVAERTVKAHITNIYNKLGINNRIQLLNLLKEYNLFPEYSAEKTLFIMKN